MSQPQNATRQQDQSADGSIKIGVQNRAGRAPYNFVRMPRPEEIAWLDNHSPASHAIYGDSLRSGYIDLKLTAKTDFYIRGTWPLKDPDKRISGHERPFEIGDKLRLPGSSLRGMIRALVEILAYSPLDPVNRSRFAYRTIGSSANPDKVDFEPCTQRYNQLMRGVQAGYLVKQKPQSAGLEEWFIRPAKRMPGNNQQAYKYEESRTDFREPVHFSTPYKSGDPRQRFWVVGSCAPGTAATTALPNRGWLVCSGPIDGRRYQWIVNEPDATKAALPIPPTDFEKHREAGLTGWIEEAAEDVRYKSDGVPVFYVQASGPLTVYFGKTYNFRVPYSYTTHDFNRAARPEKDDGRVDLARSIFGYTSNHATRSGQSGRVFFEDAMELERRDLVPTEVVLGEPRASTFQHYLEQRSESVTHAKHWDTQDAKLRGFKVYWHRPGAGIQERAGKSSTKFLRIGSGARFTARIRYDNLNDFELGALLTALELPSECAHHLGMGKPLGLGSFRIATKLVQICRVDRYAGFIGSNGSKLEQGIIGQRPKCSDDYKLDFSEWLFSRLGCGKATAEVWGDPSCPPRLIDLRHLLTYEDKPMNQAAWEHATRYLEFGIVPGYNRKNGKEQNYNEYQQVGWPAPPVKSRRRPLPPPTAVFEFGEAIPKTKRPPFENE